MPAERVHQSIVAEAGATIIGALNFVLNVNIRWLSVAFAMVVILPLILQAGHGSVTSPETRYWIATCAVLLALIVSIVLGARVWLSAEREISKARDALEPVRARNLRLAARSLAGLGAPATLVAYLFGTSTARGTELDFPEHVYECTGCELVCDPTPAPLYTRGFHTEVTYERYREALVDDREVFVLVDVVVTKHENAPWDHERPWLRRQYRGWVLFGAQLDRRDPPRIEGAMRLIDYRLRPSAGIAAFLVGVIEIEGIMRRWSEIVGDPLQGRLCDPIRRESGRSRP